MYAKVNEYKDILKSNEQEYNVYLILQDGTKVDTDISGFRIIYTLGEKIIGNFVSRRVEFNLFNTSLYNITNKEFEVFVGLKDNNAFNYMSIGKFIANKPETKDEKTDECSIIANDYSLKFKVPYEPVITFPCTVSNAIKQICEHLNIEYIANDFINANFLLEEFFIDEDANFFQVVKGLSEAGFANAHIVNSNSLIVKSPSKNKDYTFDLNEIFELKKEDNKFGPVNAVVASRVVADDGSTTEDVYDRNEESISKNGIYEYKIIQNDAIDYDRQTAVNNMLAGILDFEYVPATIETVYNPATEVADLLEVPDAKTDTSFLLYAKEITADLASGLMTIESTEKTKTETDYTSATAKDKRQKTEYKVNKMEGEITQLISKTDAQSQQITSITADLNGVETRVSSTETKIENAESAIEDTQADVQELGAKVDDEVSNLQSQIDGTIQFWNGSDIPTLSNEPASLWTTEEDKNNHRADLYTVIEDVDGELKQGKSYRFDKVGTAWTWIELKDNELSAVQALAASKAKVFTATPKVPYNVGDLWLRNKELYECQTAKDASGVYSETDWVKATKYTDDTAAALAQMTADQAVQNTILTGATEEAKEFRIENSADSYCKSVEIYGESTQETRSGKNKLPFKYHDSTGKTVYGITFTVNDDGSVTANGPASGNASFNLTSNGFDLPAGKYKLVGENKNYTGPAIRGSYYKADGTVKYVSSSHGEFVVDEDDYNFNFYIVILNGTTVNNLTFYPMLLLADETDLTFEKGGESPSSEFPSQIESVSGKNLFDKDNAVVLGAYHWSGSVITGAGYLFTTFVGCKPNTTYSVSKKAGQRFALATTEVLPANGVQTYGFVQNNTATSLTITTPSNAKYLVVGFYNSDIDTIPKDEMLASIQIEESLNSTFFVPYNHVWFKSVGENLLKNVEKKSVTSYGITFTYNEDGTYTANGTNNGGGNSAAYLNYNLFLRAGTYYTIPTNVNGHTMTGFDGTKYIALSANNRSSFTLAQDTTFKNIYIQVVNGITTPANNFVFYPMISTKPISVEDYKPYQESITTIPLLHDMRSLPNGTRDRIYWQDGKWYDEQNIGIIVLNETQGTITMPNTNQFNIDNAINNYRKKDNAITYISSHYVPVKQTSDNARFQNIADNYDYCFNFSTSPNAWTIRFKNVNITSVEEFETWLSENNTEVIYELAEPIVTELTEKEHPAMIEALEHIRTFAGITNITSDAPAKLTYYTNTALNDEYETKLNANKQYTQTIEKFAEQDITNESIKSTVAEVKTTMQNDYATKEEASTQYTQLSKDFEFKVNSAITDLKNNGVSKVVSSIITIDENGLTSGRSDSEYYNVMNNTGNYQYNAGQLLAKYDKDGAEIPRLKSDIGVIAGVKHVRENVAGVIHHKTYVIE